MNSTESVVDRLQELCGSAERLPFDDIAQFPLLTDEDFKRIGMYVQTINYIELNLRRCLEVFVRAKVLKSRISGCYQIAKASDLIPELCIAIAHTDLDDLQKEESLLQLDEISHCIDFRHKLSHYAMRRFPSDDAFILFTKDGREAKRQGIKVGKDGLLIAVLHGPDLRSMLVRAITAEKWLAQKTSVWYERYLAG